MGLLPKRDFEGGALEKGAACGVLLSAAAGDAATADPKRDVAGARPCADPS